VNKPKSGLWNHLETEAQDYHLLMQQYQLKVLDSQQVLVIQPCYHQSHPLAETNTSPDLMMSETLGLVKTLGWTVVEAILHTVRVDKHNNLINEGKLTQLRDWITELESQRGQFVSSVFISTYKMSSKNRIQVETILGKPVIDRYSVILQIFKKHAQTKEAVLQVQLAELPYLKSRLLSDWDVENESKHSKQRKGREWFDKQRLILNKRQKQIKADIEKIKAQRMLLRSNRAKSKNPTVAVIGYTNAGKTSLIKALTGTDKLQPKDELFATLDVTAHPMTFPSQMETILLDTVGFISDIPISLIASFNATLEDAALADILVHVRDVSNPDHFAQNQNVLQTLRQLNISEQKLKSMLVVGNKCDLMKEQDVQLVKQDGMFPVSTKTGLNMNDFVQALDQTLIKQTGRVHKAYRVMTGSDDFQNLMKLATITDIQTCPQDPNFSLVQVLALDYELKQLRSVLT